MSACKSCGEPSEIAGWDWCSGCTERLGRGVPLANIADAIVQMDQAGTLEDDRVLIYRLHGISPMQVQAAQEIVEERYQAASLRRRRYRGW